MGVILNLFMQDHFHKAISYPQKGSFVLFFQPCTLSLLFQMSAHLNNGRIFEENQQLIKIKILPAT